MGGLGMAPKDALKTFLQRVSVTYGFLFMFTSRTEPCVTRRCLAN